MRLVTIFNLHWICNLNLCYGLNFPQYFVISILWSKRTMWPWSFLNFSNVSSRNLPQTFLGNTLSEFPGCSSGCCKADIFSSLRSSWWWHFAFLRLPGGSQSKNLYFSSGCSGEEVVLYGVFTYLCQVNLTSLIIR